MMTTVRFGPRSSAARQRAAMNMSAVESAPPDTASTRLDVPIKSAKSTAASVSETGAARSTAHTLLFSFDALLHVQRGARIFAAEFAEGGAGRLFLAECRERLAEPEQRVRRLAAGFILRRYGKKRFSGFTIALALEQRFAQPVIC